MYTYPLGGIIRQYKDISYHMYADDSQLYTSFPPDKIENDIYNMEQCIDNVIIWMQANKLKMNNEKTEVMTCSTPQKLSSSCLDISGIRVGDNIVNFSEKVKNLGVLLDSKLSMEAQVNNICKVGYLELRKLGKMRALLDP